MKYIHFFFIFSYYFLNFLNNCAISLQADDNEGETEDEEVDVTGSSSDMFIQVKEELFVSDKCLHVPLFFVLFFTFCALWFSLLNSDQSFEVQ